MNLPSSLQDSSEWTIVGPMGPALPDNFLSRPVLGVDGGAQFTPKMDVWVGDADSCGEQINCANVFNLPSAKSKSDLGLSLTLFSECLPYQLHLWGFLGGRRDHELFNIGESLTFLEDHPESQIFLYDQGGRLSFQLLGAGEWIFSHEGLFSLGALKKTSVCLKGECAYPLEQRTTLYPLSSFGLSNVGHGKMTLYNEGAVFIYFPEFK